MRIIKSNLIFNLEHNNKKKNLILPIIDRILLISKKDKNFSNNNKIEELDKSINTLKEKILKQEEFIIKSKTIKDDLLQKVSLVENENFNSKIKLLESLEKGL
jgi:hypothetical protein